MTEKKKTITKLSKLFNLSQTNLSSSSLKDKDSHDLTSLSQMQIASATSVNSNFPPVNESEKETLPSISSKTSATRSHSPSVLDSSQLPPMVNMPDSLVAKLNFDAREKDKDKDSRPKSGSTSRVNSPPISRSNSVIAVNKPRFKLTETSHEHNLKSAKRQEKLTNMLKDLLGAKKLRNEAKSAVPNILGEHFPAQGANQPPTLFAGLVNQIKHSDETASASDASIDRSFAEKYGRCQEVIGKGAFGTVRISHKRVGDAEGEEALYAVKEFRRKPNESEKKFNRRLTSEFCISSSLKNINIIDTLDLLKDAKGDYVEVMEFCSGGDLYTLIIASGKLEYAEADCFFKQLIKGVNYMHDMGVSHRDLKPENLLLTPNGILKITDFGNSECFKMAWEQEVQLSEGICGSSPYIAPEEFTTNHFDSRCVDIWSCGVIYMAMRTGRQLWSVADPEKDEFFREYLVKRRNSTGYEPIENLKRARCRNVIYSILDPKPSRRITGKQILNSEWGREIKLCPAAKGELEVLTSPVGGNIPTVAE